jgi:sugar phosphate isomerase/epimerase
MQTLKELGYDGIEILPYDPDEIEVSEIKTLGMSISAIASGAIGFRYAVSFLDPAENKRAISVSLMKRYVRLAHDLGAPLVLVGSAIGKIEPSIDIGRATEWLVGCLRASAEYAAEAGVSLAIGPINRFETNCMNNVDEVLAMIRLTGRENIHLVLDTFHMNIEEASIEDSIGRAGEEVVHVHMADSNRWPPGFGHLNFESITAALKGIRYSGFLSLECLPKPDLATALEKGLRYIRPL